MQDTPSAGQALRDEGWARVTTNAPDTYKTAAVAAINYLMATGDPFTVDHVYELIPVELSPHSPNVVPALLGGRAKAGQIVSMGRFRTERPTRHSSKNTVWRAA